MIFYFETENYYNSEEKIIKENGIVCASNFSEASQKIYSRFSCLVSSYIKELYECDDDIIFFNNRINDGRHLQDIFEIDVNGTCDGIFSNQKDILDKLNDLGILICERISDNEYCVSDSEKYGSSTMIKFNNDGSIIDIN